MVHEHGADSCVHVPVRTCVGCRTRTPKKELLRVVVGSSEGGQAVVPDFRGTAPGRGAYLHPSLECLDRATRRRAFPRALRVEGRIDSSPLLEHLQAHSGGS